MELKSGMVILDIEEYNQLKKLQEKIATESSLVIYFDSIGKLTLNYPLNPRFYFYTNDIELRKEVEEINTQNVKYLDEISGKLNECMSTISDLEQENASLRKDIDWHKNKGFFARLFNA